MSTRTTRTARIDADRGGYTLHRVELTGGVSVEALPARHYPPQPGTFGALFQALIATRAWLGADPGDDARQNHRLRAAITRLRLAEMRAADWLPTDEMREITAAIDGVVDLLRQAPDEASP